MKGAAAARKSSGCQFSLRCCDVRYKNREIAESPPALLEARTASGLGVRACARAQNASATTREMCDKVLRSTRTQFHAGPKASLKPSCGGFVTLG